MRPQTRVRKMRSRRPSQARSSDGIRQTCYDPDIRAAKAAQRRRTSQPEDQENQEDQGESR